LEFVKKTCFLGKDSIRVTFSVHNLEVSHRRHVALKQYFTYNE